VREAVRRVGILFGAPGNRKSPDGTLWLEHPHVGGQSPIIPVRMTGTKLEWFRRHSSQIQGELNWAAASGVKGLASVTIARGLDPVTLYACESLGQAFTSAPVGPAFFPAGLGQLGLSPYPKPDQPRDEKPEPMRVYTIRLHFVEPDGLAPGERIFSVAAQGEQVVKDLDIAREAGGTNRALVKEIKGVRVTKELTLTFTSSPGAKVKAPVLCGIEMIAEGW
jgi:hypothetical protein